MLTEAQSPHADIMPEYDRHEMPARHEMPFKSQGRVHLCAFAPWRCTWDMTLAVCALSWILWLVLQAAITGAVYVPPAPSALLHAVSAADRFAALTMSAFTVSAAGRVLLKGDFNP